MALRLTGFRSLKKSKSGGGGGGSGGGGGGGGDFAGYSPSEKIKMVKNIALGSTPGGEFTTIKQIEDYQKLLDTIGDDPQFDIEKQSMEVEKRKLSAAEKEISGSLDQLETSLRLELNNRAASSFQEPYSMSYAYAEAYSMASEAAQAQLDELHATGRATKENIDKYREAINKYTDKASFYNDIRASYYSPNSKGVLGPENPEEYAYVPQVNPATGKIASVEIMKTSDIKDKGYMAVDTPVQVLEGGGTPLQLYLPTYKVGETEDGKAIMGAKFGDITYTQSDINKGEKKDTLGRIQTKLSSTLSAQRQEEGGFFGIGADEKAQQFNRDIEDMKKNGIKLNGLSFDSKDNPSGAMLRYGSKFLYKSDNGEIFELDGKDADEVRQNFSSFAKSSGKPQDDIDRIWNQPYFVNRDVLSQVKPGNVIDKNYMAPQAPPPLTSGLPSKPRPTQAEFVAKSAKVVSEIPKAVTGFFWGKQRTSAPDKPEIAKESSSGVLNPPDILAKGAQFFASKNA